MSSTRRIFYVVNVDWFFISHRMPLALEALRRGYEVYILSKDTGRKSEIESQGLIFIDIDFERSGTKPLKELFHIYELYRFYSIYKPDIIHHISIKPALYGTIAARIRGIPGGRIINAVSGLGAVFSNEKKTLIRFVVKWLMNIAYKGQKSKFIFQNPDDYRLYNSLGYLNNNNYKIVKGSGVDTNEYYYTPPVTNEKLIIILPARMLYDKGIIEFVKAAAILKTEYYGKILFQLIGGIDEFNPATISEKELMSLLDPGYIEWKGHIVNMNSEYINSDIVCLPSYREGLPKSLVEAMAIGRPIVTTDVPGCRECVINDINGYLVPVRDEYLLAKALENLIVDRDLRLSMGQASRKMMEQQMSLKAVLDETFKFYQTPNLNYKNETRKV